MTDPKLSQQVEWFHQFAKQPADQLALQATEENRELFMRFVSTCLPDHNPPEDQSSKEFASAVIQLRGNERRWNQALMSALIQADDLNKSQEWQNAVSMLESFADSCPSKLFREAAQNQACNYKPR